MKKIFIVVGIVCMNISFLACTDDSLVEAQNELRQQVQADGDGDEGHIDPPPPPPGDGS